MRSKVHYPAAACSLLVVGLGQAVKGESEKAVALLLFCYFFLPAACYLALLVNGFLFLYLFSFAVILAIILWAYNVWDALVR